MSDESKAFTVTDRRRFTQEGEVRNPEAPEIPPAPGPVAAKAAEPPSAVSPSPTAQAGGGAGITFSEFLMSLAAQGAALVMEDVEQLSLEDRREGAAHIIAVLEMLEDKTQGRRSDEEDRVLKQILYELRTAFVSRFTTR